MLSRFQYLKQWQKKMFQAGWTGVSWPKEYGGRRHADGASYLL